MGGDWGDVRLGGGRNESPVTGRDAGKMAAVCKFLSHDF